MKQSAAGKIGKRKAIARKKEREEAEAEGVGLREVVLAGVHPPSRDHAPLANKRML